MVRCKAREILRSATRCQVSDPATRTRRLKACGNDSVIGGHGVGADT